MAEEDRKLVSVSLDIEEYKIIQEACDRDNRTISSFLRDAGLRKAKQILE